MTSTRACRVVIVDDHSTIIEMMRQIVESLPGFQVVAAATEAGAARAVCRREQPDLIILDLVMPEVTGFDLFEDLRGLCARSRFLIFSGHLRPAVVRACLMAGAHGMIEKTAPLDDFKQALRTLGSGRVYFSRAASDAVRRMVIGDPSVATRLPSLTGRESAVLRAIAEGLSSKEISQRLGISRHTVVNYRTRIARKTGLRGVARLSRYACQIGLIMDPPEFRR